MCVSVDGFGTHNGEVSISERGLVKIKRVKGILGVKGVAGTEENFGGYYVVEDVR